MKKLNYKKNIILFIILVAIISGFLYLKKDIINKGILEKNNKAATEIDSFNNIINQDVSKLDIKSCEGLKELKDLCVSQIKDKQRPENKFTDTRQCEKVKPKAGESIRQTQDICILNTVNRITKSKNDSKLCNSIKSIDIRNLCKTQILNKFTN